MATKPAYDYDFIGFTYDGKHSIRDLNIYRTSDGSRYNENLSPSVTDKTAEVPGGDGLYYFGSQHKQRQFSISFAFDQLTEQQFRELRQLFSKKELVELSFDERPYVVYSVKPTGTPTIKTVCFENDEYERVYKGEGTLSLVAYYPYGHTPTKLWTYDDEKKTLSFAEADGKNLAAYNIEYYPTKEQWVSSSGLENVGYKNAGDIPAPFIWTGAVSKDQKLSIGNTTITFLEEASGVTWDSRTGLIIGTVGGETRPLLYSGNSCGTIPVGATCANASFKLWYY
jgi:hypothetical protein